MTCDTPSQSGRPVSPIIFSQTDPAADLTLHVSDDAESTCNLTVTSTHSTRKGSEIFYRDMCFKLKKQTLVVITWVCEMVEITGNYWIFSYFWKYILIPGQVKLIDNQTYIWNDFFDVFEYGFVKIRLIN